jgi:hypothetical protein
MEESQFSGGGYIENDRFSYLFLCASLPEGVEKPPYPETQEEWAHLSKMAHDAIPALLEKIMTRIEEIKEWLAELNIFGVSKELLATTPGGVHPKDNRERYMICEVTESRNWQGIGKVESEGEVFEKSEFQEKVMAVLAGS